MHIPPPTQMLSTKHCERHPLMTERHHQLASSIVTATTQASPLFTAVHVFAVRAIHGNTQTCSCQ